MHSPQERRECFIHPANVSAHLPLCSSTMASSQARLNNSKSFRCDGLRAAPLCASLSRTSKRFFRAGWPPALLSLSPSMHNGKFLIAASQASARVRERLFSHEKTPPIVRAGKASRQQKRALYKNNHQLLPSSNVAATAAPSLSHQMPMDKEASVRLEVAQGPASHSIQCKESMLNMFQSQIEVFFSRVAAATAALMLSSSSSSLIFHLLRPTPCHVPMALRPIISPTPPCHAAITVPVGRDTLCCLCCLIRCCSMTCRRRCSVLRPRCLAKHAI